MNIRKAVITAAHPRQRSLPLQRLVDRDGEQKSALRILVEEARSAGVEEIGIVVHPGDEDAYAKAIGEAAPRIAFIAQAEPLGYGHALALSRAFVADEPFLHLISDHLYVARGSESCSRQLVEIAQSENAAVSAVQATRESMLPYFGAVGGTRVPHRKDLYVIEEVLEKPTPTEAEQTLMVPGLRAGHYLCFFGMHVLTPTIHELLEEDIQSRPSRAPVQLSPALARLARRERYLALEAAGMRHNLGVKYGLLTAELALALNGVDRAEVLQQLVELLAQRERTGI